MSDAAAVVEGLGGPERPAGPAAGLIADVADEGLAPGEVRGGIEGIWEIHPSIGVILALGESLESGMTAQDASEQGNDVPDRGVHEAAGAGDEGEKMFWIRMMIRVYLGATAQRRKFRTHRGETWASHVESGLLT